MASGLDSGSTNGADSTVAPGNLSSDSPPKSPLKSASLVGTSEGVDERAMGNSEPTSSNLDVNDDGLKTPTSQTPSSLRSLASLDQHALLESRRPPYTSQPMSTPVKNDHIGLFISEYTSRQQNLPEAEPTSELSKSSLNEQDDVSALTSAGKAEEKSKDDSTDTIVAPNQVTGNPRPNSEPDFQTMSQSRRREAHGYTHHANLPFGAPSNLSHNLQPLRAQAISPQQSYHYHRSNASSASDLGQMPSGAKTAGNTPAQSPAPFFPSAVNKRWTGETEEGHYHAPLQQSVHLQAPKE